MSLCRILLFLFLLPCLSNAQQWEQIATVPDGYQSHHSFGFSVRDTGYLMSGSMLVGNTEVATNRFYAYIPDVDEWVRKDDFPGPARSFAIGDVLDTVAYFGFGIDNGRAFNDLWKYDPSTDEWTELASCPCVGRAHPAFISVRGKILVGLGNSSSNMNDWWAYDIATNTWEQKTDFPAAERHHPYQFTDGQYVYTGFGHGNGFISNQWYRYDIDTDEWTEMATLPAEGRVAGQQFEYDGFGYVLSGNGDNHGFMPTGEFWQYDPTANAWTELPPHPGISRWAPSSFVIGDEAYLINGYDTGPGFFSTNYKIKLSALFAPRLSIQANNSVLNVTGDSLGAFCDPFFTGSISVYTPFVFDEDVRFSLSVDSESDAVEGVDFVLPVRDTFLPAGENTIEIPLLILDDAIVGEDRTLLINLASDSAVIERAQLELTLEENDEPFTIDELQVIKETGSGVETNFVSLGGDFNRVVNQFIYPKEYLQENGMGKTAIQSMFFDVTVNSRSIYQNFTVRLANYDGMLTDSFITDAAFQTMHTGSIVLRNGWTEIQFTEPFLYDGAENLLVEICYANRSTFEGATMLATEVNFTGTIVGESNDGTGCPIEEIKVSENTLPNTRFKVRETERIFREADEVFRSTINAGDSVFFHRNDSILAGIKSISQVESACISASLISSSGDWQESGEYQYIDHITDFSLSPGSEGEFLLTLVIPKPEAVDFEAIQSLGLYTSDEITVGTDPNWQELEIRDLKQNDDFALVTVDYVGNGAYVFAENMVVSTRNPNRPTDFDQVLTYDPAGRLLSQAGEQPDLPPGLYIQAYFKEGAYLGSRKVFLKPLR